MALEACQKSSTSDEAEDIDSISAGMFGVRPNLSRQGYADFLPASRVKRQFIRCECLGFVNVYAQLFCNLVQRLVHFPK